jgi:sigma-B regulation protein RsbU (phosphoserine phosphatase)
VPEDVWQKGLQDEGSLASYLRLAKGPAGEGVLGHCVRTTESVRIGNLSDHESFAGLEGGCRTTVRAMLAPVGYAGKPIGVLALVRNPDRPEFTGNEFELFRSVAEQSAFALGNALVHLEASAKRQMDRQLRVAADVQRVLLPAAEPEFPGYRIHGMNVPAQLISGDYYDYITLDGNALGVAIADVSGKGVSAGLMMATCRSALRAAVVENGSPAAAVGVVNRQLFPDMREDMFISLAYLVLESDSGRVRMARAGHDAPLMFRKDSAEIEVMKPGGLALGVDEGPVFERVTRDFEASFESGDCLLLYTDGVNEAENLKGEEFGKERLREAFREAAPRGAEAVVAEMQDRLARFVGGNRQMDDITLIAIERR